MISANHQVTAEQMLQINALAHRCQQHDGHVIPFFSHILMQHRNLPCNLLYYHRQQLIGFLSPFFFYDNACEITLMVDPKWRRRHIGKALLTEIWPVIQSRKVEYILFSSPKQLNDAWFTTLQLTYQNSEVQMQWENTSPLPSPPTGIKLSIVSSESDISLLADIDSICFHTNKQEIESRYSRLLTDSRYTIVMMQKDHQAIGKGHLLYETDQVQLSDIAVAPSQQGHGLGQALVAYCILYAQSKSALPIRLDVDSSNSPALHIYQKLGFKTINAWDYWVAPAIAFSGFISFSGE